MIGDGPAEKRDAPHFVDLHLHSTASDGVLEPEGVVAAAVQAGLVAMALTDHDSTAGVARAQAAGALAGVELVAGVELSAHEGEKEIHILGLHLESLSRIERRLGELREGRLDRAAAIVAKLRTLGMALSIDTVVKQANGGAVGRPHIARALVEGGFTTSIRRAFDQYLGAGRIAYVPKQTFSIGDAVALIHEAGGIAVIAHPSSDGTVENITRLKSMGMDGVEVRHPSHSAEDVARTTAICEHLKMVKSGGSDWHGMDAGKRRIGAEEIPYAWMEEQKLRAAQIRAQHAAG